MMKKKPEPKYFAVRESVLQRGDDNQIHHVSEEKSFEAAKIKAEELNKNNNLKKDGNAK